MKNCTKANQGWYYLSVSYADCDSRVDSVYIAIKREITEAPRTAPENQIAFSGIPDILTAAVTWEMDGILNKKKLEADYRSGYPDFKIYFNGYRSNNEPEDAHMKLIVLSDFNPYVVYVTSLYSNILFIGSEGTVYISHENGKIKARFCSISFGGSNGVNPFSTTATGSIKAP